MRLTSDLLPDMPNSDSLNSISWQVKAYALMSLASTQAKISRVISVFWYYLCTAKYKHNTGYSWLCPYAQQNDFCACRMAINFPPGIIEWWVINTKYSHICLQHEEWGINSDRTSKVMANTPMFQPKRWGTWHAWQLLEDDYCFSSERSGIINANSRKEHAPHSWITAAICHNSDYFETLRFHSHSWKFESLGIWWKGQNVGHRCLHLLVLFCLNQTIGLAVQWQTSIKRILILAL